MIKKISRIIGLISIIVGFISFFTSLNIFLTTKTTTGKIIEILERKSGTKYESVSTGGESPCKLKFSFTNDQNILKEKVSSSEYELCGPILWFSYYKVGDIVKIRYSPEDKYSPEIDNLIASFGFPVGYILFGVGLVVFSSKLPRKKK